MGRFKKVVRVLEDLEVEWGELVTMAEAGRMLGITVQGVVAAVGRGRFTLVIDTESASRQQGRRLLLRREVMEYASR